MIRRRSLWVTAVSLVLACGCLSTGQDRQAKTNQFLDDKVTRDRIAALFRETSSNRLDGVQVSVTNGTAYLRGVVPTPADQKRAVQLTEAVHRVRHIENEIRVQQ